MPDAPREPTTYEEAFDRWRDEAADYTTDELIDELQRLIDENPSPRDAETNGKMDAIYNVLKTR